MVKPYFVKHSKVIGLSKSGTFQVKNRQISMKYDKKNDENCMKSTANWNPNRFRVNHFNQMRNVKGVT